MYLCICKGVTLKTVREVIATGASSVDEVERRCEAGGDCGSCRESIADLIDDHAASGRACSRACQGHASLAVVAAAG